jgi:probable rRNA maturation factor
MLEALGLTRAELSVMVCDDATIHGLNRAHRKKDRPTDVLAFALREGKVMPGAEDLLGDVVISLDTARRQAREHGRSLWAEVTMLLAHGLLHLVGYDHRTDAEHVLGPGQDLPFAEREGEHVGGLVLLPVRAVEAVDGGVVTHHHR